ncbi:MAG TPA: methyltransferase domain-containing protein [Dehalococcoidia bacterium]|jgi:SAM-dependent methyltransferase|nr:methyltransferase domain-containing protein [Dehalococcoidia bacterium]
MVSDPYAGFAELYDFAYWDFTDDIDFYENLARIHDAPVLELGVGTGRLAVRLAAAGFRVVGLDSSAPMLERARENMRAASVSEKRLELVQAAMTDFDLVERFGLVVVAANTFQHLLTTSEQRACLERAARHLVPGGVFAMSIRSPASVSWEDAGAPAPIMLDWTRRDPATGDIMMKMVAAQPDPASMTRRLTYIYDRIAPDGGLRRVLFETDLRYSTEAEIELLLQEAGLRVTHVYGDYDLAPVGPGTEQLIFVARAGSTS